MAPRAPGKNAFMFVLVTVMIDMIGFGLVMPVTPTLIAELAHLPLEEAAPWGGYLSAVYAVLNFLAGPVLGNLSDRFGRRPVLLVAMLALGANFLLMGLATALWVLFLGRVLSGIAGATMSTASAYIADTTDPKDRGRAFGMIGAAFGVGFILGPVMGGLLGEYSARMPFFVAAGLSGINFLYGAFVLPESLSKESRRPFDIKRANPLGAFRHFKKLPQVSYLILAAGLLQFSQMLFPVVWAFFTELQFGWTPRETGLSLGAVGVSSAIVQGGLIGRFLDKFGPTKTALIAMVSGASALSLYAFATEGWMVYCIICVGSLSGMAPPAINAIASSRVDVTAQGELSGAISSVQSVATILSPLVMTQTLFFFTHDSAPFRMVGAPFLVAALSTSLASIPFLIGVRAGQQPAPAS